MAASIPLLFTAAEARAAAPSPTSPSVPSARRTAARALERSFSTQWLPDVDSRLRMLDELIDVAPERATPDRFDALPPLGSGRREEAGR